MAVHAKKIFYAPRETTVSPRFFAWAMNQSMLDAEQCRLADIPASGESIPAGGPVLTVLASGDDMVRCEQNLEAIQAEVGRRLYD